MSVPLSVCTEQEHLPRESQHQGINLAAQTGNRESKEITQQRAKAQSRRGFYAKEQKSPKIGQKMWILPVKCNYRSSLQKTAVACATIWSVRGRNYTTSSCTLIFNHQKEISVISSQVPLLLTCPITAWLFSVPSQLFLLPFPSPSCKPAFCRVCQLRICSEHRIFNSMGVTWALRAPKHKNTCAGATDWMYLWGGDIYFILSCNWKTAANIQSSNPAGALGWSAGSISDTPHLNPGLEPLWARLIQSINEVMGLADWKWNNEIKLNQVKWNANSCRMEIVGRFGCCGRCPTPFMAFL